MSTPSLCSATKSISVGFDQRVLMMITFETVTTQRSLPFKIWVPSSGTPSLFRIISFVVASPLCLSSLGIVSLCGAARGVAFSLNTPPPPCLDRSSPTKRKSHKSSVTTTKANRLSDRVNWMFEQLSPLVIATHRVVSLVMAASAVKSTSSGMRGARSCSHAISRATPMRWWQVN